MSNIFRMHVLGADHGDCLWIEYGASIAPHRVLIDAGTPGTFERLKPYLEKVRSNAPSHELLVITHVDDDHIGGCLKVLSDPEISAQFRNIWFNGYDHLAQLAQDESFGAVQGERLTQAVIDRKIPWNVHFGNEAVVRDKDDLPVTVELQGGAKVTVLGPSRAKLEKLLPHWRKVVTDAGLVPGGVSRPEPESEDEEAFGRIDIEDMARTESKDDTAVANGSSIALLIQYEGRSFLLAADSHPEDLLAGIKAFTGGKRLSVDVFKLPHHGSKGNVTAELLDAVDTNVVVFSSSGARFRHPDKEAVARVIKRYKPNVKLCFNYESDYTSIWRDATLQKEWGYQVEYGTNDIGISIHLL
ncbi:MBL fold metallo-hydrolase [uncultured Hydrogenophaga sp.]|uniref:ComEC/Rec2 family competence protein n=1 Tax=uncultured Hydrogenophaga sp. TaxID=199683 RepID=UPI0025878B3B|nr:MBL fold metallo-hydrolase [uncultured Hydrogenophaga sp.]